MTDNRLLAKILEDANRYFSSIGNQIAARDAWEMAINAYFRGNPLSRRVFRRRLVAALNVDFPAQRELALDFGCGPGIFSAFVASSVEHVTAVDLKPEVARGFLAARNVENVDVLSADALHEETYAERFDRIYALDVLEHIEDLEPVIEFLRSRLRPTGLLVLSGPTENLLYRFGRWVVRFPGDYHFWSVMEIEELLERAGFSRKRGRSLPLPGPLALFHVIAYVRGT